MESMRWQTVAGILLTSVILVLVVGLFTVDVGATDPGPVAFDDTVQIGLTDEQRLALDDEVHLPKMQVFYGGYRYVVGYYGVERGLADLDHPDTSVRFGDPLAMYVTDYARTGVTVNERGYPIPVNPPTWTSARSASFVIESEARSPVGTTILPFSDETEAEDFADDYGGTVVDWETLRTYDFADVGDIPHREQVAHRHARADDQLERAAELRDRPISIVVGEDAPTVQGAINEAPPDTSVLVPPGTYKETVTINRSITLLGHGATIDGGENETVITTRADEVAVVGLAITGVGDQLRDPDAAEDDPDAWDHNIELGYGHGDAGIAFIGASDGFVADVSIETPANGVLLRDAPGAVVHNVTIDGSDNWRDGFMGVMSMRSPGVVEAVDVTGGRDGVYMHRSHGTVVRNGSFTDGRFGMHLMHTSETLLQGNLAHNQAITGIVLMTDPHSNAIVGNDLRHNSRGLVTVGSSNYVAENIFAHNGHGIRINDHGSRYEHNTIVDNDFGVYAGGFVPTNAVTRNDFVGNDENVDPGFGPLQVWSDRGVGNYWEGALGHDREGVLDRAYAPTDPIDRRLNRVDGAQTLARSPGLQTAMAFRDSIPGLRGGVVDLHPLHEPANPDRVALARDEHPTNRDQEGSP